MAIEIDGNITRRYYHTFTADDGTSYRWEIHQDGYDSTVDPAEVLSASTRTHCVTRWAGMSDDEFSPILGSETTISFFEDDDDPVVDALIDNVSSSEEQFAIVIKDTASAAVRWVGFVDYEDIRRPEDGLVSLSITARDGLGRLEDKYYVSNTATGALYEGRATLTSILAALLQQIGWGLDFYVAIEIYPAAYSGDEPLSNIDNPLDNLYAERLLFTAVVEGETDIWGRKIPENAPIKSIEVLKAILERFCLRIFQADGAWHIYQVNQYFSTTENTAPALDTAGERAIKFRRWRYNSSGSYQSTDIFTHAVTISNDTIKRSVANASLAKTYSAAQITYNHGAIRLIRQPGFDSVAFQIRDTPNYGETDQWITNDETKSIGIQFGQDALKDGAWKIFDLDGVDWTQKTGYESLFSGWANGSGTGAGTIDEAIGDYKVYQTTDATIPSGSSLRAVLRAFLINQSNSSLIHGDFNYALPIQIKINDATPKYWTKGVESDTWETTPNWVLMENPTPGQGIINFANDLPEMDISGTITFSIGGPFDASEYSDQTDSRYDDISAVVCDHADLVYILDDGTYNAEATSVINYVDRDVPKIKQIDTKIGDGPTNLNLGALTFDSDGLKTTGAWAEGADAASGSPTDSLNQLHSRIILRGTNEPRNKHQAQYFDAGQILWPFYSIRRSSVNYIAWDIDYDWQADVTAGTWCEVRQFGFTDDLVSGIDSGAGSANWNSSYDRSGFLLSRLSKAFFSDTARRITRTTAYISAGTDDTYPQTISVEAIPDALLDVGDYINIVAPDLTFYTVRIAATQLPGDTTLSIDDPDNEGSNFNFSSGVSYPASIFMADDTVMTLARLGEQGFAVTVLGNNIGVIDEDILAPTSRTSLNVRNWAITMKTGDTVQIQQSDDEGTYVEVELTANAPKGSTSISFTSTSLQVANGDPIKPTGTVNRADFQVTADAITAYLGNPGDVIATLSADSTWDGTRTTLPCSGGPSEALKANDPILVYTQMGSVVKGIVNADTAVGAGSIVLTAASGNLTASAKSGDKIVPGSVTGLRIDMDSIDVLADRIASSNYAAGTTGWSILGNGSAEFNNVTVRGNIQVGAGSDVDFSYVTGETKPEDNATAGATWGVNIASQPADSAILNSQQIWNDITGTGKPEDGATVGAGWDDNLTGKPEGADNLTDTLSPITGLNLTGTYMGYYDGSNWKTFMQSNGNFYLGGTGGNLQWVSSTNTLSITGAVTITGGSGISNLSDAGSLATKSTVGTGDIDNDAITTVKIADGQITAGKISVSSLSAISADIGSITAGDLNIGSGTFVVTSGGELTATSATITGAITATSGSLSNLSISGTLTIGASGNITDSGANYSITSGGININAGTITLTKDSSGVAFTESTTIDSDGVEVTSGLATQTTIVSGTNGLTSNGLTLRSSSGLPTASSVNASNLTGELRWGSNAIWHAGNLPFSFSSAASGDVIYYNGTNWVNLAKGTDGQVLTLASGLPSWAAVATGGGGTVTSVSVGDGLSVTDPTTTPAISLNFSGLTASGTLVGTDDLVVVDDTATRKTQINTIPLSIFNNDSGWTSNAGTVTSVSVGTGLSVTNPTTTPAISLDAHLVDLSALSAVGGAEDIMVSTGAGTWGYKDAVYMEDNLNGSNNGPKFVGSNIYGSGGTPANQSFSGWLYVKVSGNVYRVALYADGA